jgi:hypothetical protein
VRRWTFSARNIRSIEHEVRSKPCRTYAVAVLEKCIADSQKDSESPYELLERGQGGTDGGGQDALKTGWMTKEGAIKKSWKKRFFVVRPDYKIDYYDKEEVCCVCCWDR